MYEAIMFFESLSFLSLEYLRELFVNRCDITKYSLGANKHSLSLICINILKNSFSYSGAVLWNSFPPDLRQTESLNDFRHQLSSY